MRRSLVFPRLVAVGVVLSFALMVVLGSGSRADARCEQSFFVTGGSWSWTHLGTRCEYGEPTQVGYAYSWAAWLTLALLFTAGVMWFDVWDDRRVAAR